MENYFFLTIGIVKYLLFIDKCYVNNLLKLYIFNIHFAIFYVYILRR